MRLFSLTIFVVLGTLLPVNGGDFSYVVLNARIGQNSLVRVSADGSSMSTIANGVGGYGLAKDHEGNYLVAARTSLLRVAPSGVVSTIAGAPSGSWWGSVVEEAAGTFVLADRKQHAIWRISADGQSIARISNYPVSDPSKWENAQIALDSDGNIVLLEDNGTTHLFRISAAGTVMEISLSRTARHCSNLMIDQQGQYVFMDFSAGELLRVTPSGQVTTIQTVVPRVMNVVGLTQDPGTGDYVIAVTFRQRLIRMGASGSSFLTPQDPTYLSSPEALIVEQNK